MKTTLLRAIVPAILAIGFAGTASAAIDSDLANLPGNGTGAGELFLTVADIGGSTQRSYVLDLGVTANDFIANDSGSYSLSFAADANLLNILNNVSGTIVWNIAAAHNTYGDGVTPQLGYLSTGPSPLTPGNTTSGLIGLGNSLQNIGIYLNSANSVLGGGGSSAIFQSTDNAFWSNGWGDTWHLGGGSTSAGVGQAMDFYFVAADPGEDFQYNDTAVSQFAGQWSLSSEGLLSYNAGPQVPLPAGIWLLSSALLGMAGVSRRRREKQAA